MINGLQQFAPLGICRDYLAIELELGPVVESLKASLKGHLDAPPIAALLSKKHTHDAQSAPY